MVMKFFFTFLRVWNVFMWLMLASGTGMLMVFYITEYSERWAISQVVISSQCQLEWWIEFFDFSESRRLLSSLAVG